VGWLEWILGVAVDGFRLDRERGVVGISMLVGRFMWRSDGMGPIVPVDRYVHHRFFFCFSPFMSKPGFFYGNGQSRPESRDSPGAARVMFLEQQLLTCKISFKALYSLLLKACLLLDMNTGEPPSSASASLLSRESETTLKVWSDWTAINESFMLIAYVELLFEKYKNYEVPVQSLFKAYESIYDSIKRNPDWLGTYEVCFSRSFSSSINYFYFCFIVFVETCTI
jgi:hypothetical protein